MEIKTIQIRISADIADRFAATSEQEKRKIEALISLKLGNPTQPERSLEDIMAAMGAYAEAQGLTPERLDALLQND